MIGAEGTEKDPRRFRDYIDEDEPIRRQGKIYHDEEREVFISKEREQKILESYEEVVVQDFGDDYHVSEEILAKNNVYYKQFSKVRKQKNTYRRLDQYVEAMRNVMECVDLVAENNGIYSADDFKEKWASGKIEIFKLRVPKYKGKDAKRLNWEYVTDFILGDEDPKDIIKTDVDHIESEDELEEAAALLFSPEELKILSTPTTDEEREQIRHDLLTNTGDIIKPLTRNELKQISKTSPSFLLNMKELRRKERNIANTYGSRRHSFVYDMQSDDIEAIARYDRKFSPQEIQPPKFKGSIMKSKDVDLYVRKVNDYADRHTYVQYNGKSVTPAEMREIELKNDLAEHGWNILRLYGNRDKQKQLRKAYKEDRKKMEKIKERILLVQERNKNRQETLRSMGTGSGRKKKKRKRKK